RMLEDPSFQSVVCWGPLGDCFVVKDMNEFTKAILPRMFKHSNFASFVRQLNKYDFHKVKNTDDNQFGEHSWTFRHPDFHADRRDALENIKRKVPAARKYTPAAAAAAGPSTLAPASASTTYPPSSSTGASYTYPSYGAPGPSSSSSALNNNNPNNNPSGGQGRRSPSPTHAHLTSEIARLKDEGDDLRGRIRALERNYESVLVELVGFQRGMAQQDGLLQSLVGWFLEGGE
ncbi:winged helix DNA-binding domain-containing protein, partial [Pholiota molesta]